MIPALMILRDRVSYAQQCVGALDRAGLDIHIVDHGSTYLPAVEWLETCGLPVHRRENNHPRSLWEWDGLQRIVGADRPYIVTDPDVVVDDECPDNWPLLLVSLLQMFPGRRKAALGLRIDDLPDHYGDAEKVKEWESQYWRDEVAPDIYDAHTDTTLAMYQPLSRFPTFELGPGLRTGGKYVARHLAWYENSSDPSDEIRYYREHAEAGISHWLDPVLYMKGAS